ncbi:hypothetical protein AB0C76_33120 [Kitasatospora sp. NPDC048722]|uniref:hypothetical protein n=1 Tax=Kitasatospora sp. NPDC048722 TaxID=3155639 RepID=UPI0033C08A87
MPDVSWAEGLSTGAALFSAAAAGLALKISNSATKAAEASTTTAQAVAAIERQRWHHDLTPQISATITEAGSDQANLRLTFEGPASLLRLDAVEISIRDDGYTHIPSTAGGPSQEDLDAHVWGPYRFKPGIDEASADGRSVPAVPVELGAWRQLLLERTRPPLWQGPNSDGYWRSQYDGAPVRLWVRCRREGHEPWLLTLNVPVRDVPPQGD